MQFETLLLRGLFLACLTVSGLVFGAMLTSHPQSANGQPRTVASAPTAQTPACTLPADGITCLRRAG